MLVLASALPAPIPSGSIKDAEGHARPVYRQPISRDVEAHVIFYGRNELPQLSDYAAGFDNVLILGTKPPLRGAEAWNQFTACYHSDGVESHGHPLGRRPLILVERSPAGLAQLASIGQVRDIPPDGNDVAGGGLGQAFDRMLAAKFFDASGSLKKSVDCEGEILLVQALRGDKGAASELQNRLAHHFRYSDLRTRGIPHAPAYDLPFATKIDIGQLLLVHVTGHLPILNGDHFEIHSSFDHSGQKQLRTTLHCTFNHHVIGHAVGNWDDSPIIVMSPFCSATAVNSLPLSFNPIDVFFDIVPGRPFRIPREELFTVQPANLDSGELWRCNEKDCFYDRNASPERFAALGLTAQKALSTNVWEAIEGVLLTHLIKLHNSLERGQVATERLIGRSDEKTRAGSLGDIPARLASASLDDVVAEILGHKRTEKIRSEETVIQLRNAIGSAYASTAKVEAAKVAMNHFGYPVFTGGIQDTSDKHLRTALHVLAERLGLDYITHEASPSCLAEDLYKVRAAAVLAGQKGNEAFHEARRAPKELVHMPRGTLRMLYLSGFL